MKQFLAVLLMAGVSSFGADTKKAPSDVEALKQLERDWTDAQKTKDIDKLNLIIAEDWMGLGYDGNKSNRADFIASVKSGASKIESFTFADMEVKIIGNVGIVQGGDTEKSSVRGEDTSGKWVWTDVFVKKDGRWQAVRSQSARVK